ncbi:hypothetical protein [Agromyces humi]|uniref:hypothetical protein n=1 Tax=Agromyces humi TaxID=1766800 RepID=UPI00135A3364|nr:hypothetical protein [Agromyces humi]
MDEEKIANAVAKQLDYLVGLYGPRDAWLNVSVFANFVANAARIGGRDKDRLQEKIRKHLEKLAEAGEVQRWTDLWGAGSPRRKLLYRRTVSAPVR